MSTVSYRFPARPFTNPFHRVHFHLSHTTLILTPTLALTLTLALALTLILTLKPFFFTLQVGKFCGEIPPFGETFVFTADFHL